MANSEKTARPSTELAQEQPLSLPPSLTRQTMCFLALGPPGYEEHWTSAQCDEAFEEVSGRIQSVVMKCIFISVGLSLASLQLMSIAGAFPPYVDYASSIASSMLAITFVMGVFGQGAGLPCSIVFFFDPDIPKYLLKRGCFFLGVYYFCCFMSVFYAACALHVFVFAMLINGFFSENIAYRGLGAYSLVTYVIVVRILLRFRKRGTSSRFRSV